MPWRRSWYTQPWRSLESIEPLSDESLMQYQIVTDFRTEQVETMVKDLMKAGWTTIGGVPVYILDGTPWFAQAMTKP
jgi:hypothetical protein